MPTSISKRVRTPDGIKVYYEATKGNPHKPTLLFIHGLSGNLTAWNIEREYFHKLHYSTIVVDVRGCGLSDRPQKKSDYHLSKFVTDMLTVIQTEKPEHLIIVGHCFGGMIAIMLTAGYPNIAQSLILIETSDKPPFLLRPFIEHSSLRFVLSLLATYSPSIYVPNHNDYAKFINTNDLYWKRILFDIAHMSLHSFFSTAENLLDYNSSSLLRKIVVPTLIVSGIEDTIFPPSVEQSLHQQIKTSVIKYVKSANHIIVINNAQILSKMIYSFIKKWE